jgi:hypothetical protein
MTQDIDDDERFSRLHSAFIQFDKQMSAQMAVGLISHHLPGRMSPRFYNVAPHEVLWPNMGITSLRRFVRTVMALAFFVGMIFLWAIPTSFLGVLSQLESLRQDTSWLSWLKSWPDWVISIISGGLLDFYQCESVTADITKLRSWRHYPSGTPCPASRTSTLP